MTGRRCCRGSYKRRRPSLSRSTRAELQFPVSRVDRLLRERHYVQRLSSSTPVFLAGVLEYLTANILELAGDEAHHDHRIRITPEHVQRAVDSNPQLSHLLDDVTMPQVDDKPRSTKNC
ncbi:histone H2A-Bbd type 1-like [Trichechus manatus latirostris]|uniref:Histone H2A n=1 Tax=Trichechus manatus latirostris TaxID=127582 RepID=A0A2Y9E318_TRIMA|nr:histone H2A-Bbd type 1-like [Trichechus manatus latirostris]